MPAAIQVSFRKIEPTEAMRAKIDSLLRLFDPYEDVIVYGDVVTEAVGKKGEKTQIEIRVELDVPKGKVVAKREADLPSPAGQWAFETAATEAFRTASDQLRRHLSKLRSYEEKQLDHSIQHGRVGQINSADRNGFVEMPDGVSLLFSADVVEGEFEALQSGDQVVVKVADTEAVYGPQASWLKPLGPLGARG